MTAASHPIDSLLGDILEDTPTPEPVPADHISTAAAVLRLAGGTPGSLTAEERTIAEALCRKIAIAKRVWAVYGSDWRKLPDVAELPTPYWAPLIAGLMRHGVGHSTDDATARGFALKCLNGALGAFDLVDGRSDVPRLVAVGAALADTCATVEL